MKRLLILLLLLVMIGCDVDPAFNKGRVFDKTETYEIRFEVENGHWDRAYPSREEFDKLKIGDMYERFPDGKK